MAGHIALGALQPELPVKSCDELLQGRLRSGAQDRRYQISPFDFTVMAGVAHLGEMRLSGFLLAGTKYRSGFARPGATFNFREVLRGCGFRAAAVTAAALLRSRSRRLRLPRLFHRTSQVRVSQADDR